MNVYFWNFEWKCSFRLLVNRNPFTIRLLVFFIESFLCAIFSTIFFLSSQCQHRFVNYFLNNVVCSSSVAGVVCRIKFISVIKTTKSNFRHFHEIFDERVCVCMALYAMLHHSLKMITNTLKTFYTKTEKKFHFIAQKFVPIKFSNLRPHNCIVTLFHSMLVKFIWASWCLGI